MSLESTPSGDYEYKSASRLAAYTPEEACRTVEECVRKGMHRSNTGWMLLYGEVFGTYAQQIVDEELEFTQRLTSPSETHNYICELYDYLGEKIKVKDTGIGTVVPVGKSFPDGLVFDPQLGVKEALEYTTIRSKKRAGDRKRDSLGDYIRRKTKALTYLVEAVPAIFGNTELRFVVPIERREFFA